METSPVGWTLLTCDQERHGAGLLEGVDPDLQDTNTHVYDLFHEDAQVGFEDVCRAVPGHFGALDKISACHDPPCGHTSSDCILSMSLLGNKQKCF